MQHMICRISISVGNNVRKHVELYSNSPAKIYSKVESFLWVQTGFLLGKSMSHLYDVTYLTFIKGTEQVFLSFFETGVSES